MIGEKDFLILVDENDKAWGKLEKELVHEKGLLHRAFSVFLFNLNGEMLLQQRADDKYHSGGLWTNACCSHPRYGEEINDAVKRRLKEEMGLQCNTHFVFSFQYKAEFQNGLIENEFDHVFIGFCDTKPVHNPVELKSWKYENTNVIKHNLENDPSLFTVWFRLCFDEVMNHFKRCEKLFHVQV